MRAFVLLIILFVSNASYSIQTIDIKRGNFDPTPIAINKFASNSSSEASLAEKVIEVINNDLKSCGLFKPIPPAAFIENKTGIEHRPLFAAWSQINATILLNGYIKKINSSTIEISFILWDVAAKKDIAGEVIEVPRNLWRRASHQIADKIYERMTGDKGYFDTRIAYISESGAGKTQVKRLAIMDQDGFNHAYLTDGRNLVLTPRLSPDGNHLLYLSFIKGRKPQVHMRNLKTGRDIIIGKFPNMNFAPRFAPDGRKALISIAKNGATNIFEVDLMGNSKIQLTNNNFINTSANYSPDGSQIVFNSDRSGSPQIYTMNRDGTNVKRISFESGTYYSPVWSPRGDYIAFTKMHGGFSIGVMKTNGERERLITNGYLVESPTWAPNGRVLIYTRGQKTYKKQPAKSRLYSIDITGYNDREVKTPKDASDGDWSSALD